MANKFLDYTGLNHFWGKIKTLLNNKSDIGHTHTASDVTDLADVAKTGSYKSLVNQNELAKTNTANTFNGEQTYINETYCKDVIDTASGVGCAFKASRGLYNEALLDKIIMTISTGKIPFYKYTGTDSGQMTGLVEVSHIDSNGKYNGDADTIDGYHIRTAKEGDTGLAGYITFITG